jgi:hypothetical protein
MERSILLPCVATLLLACGAPAPEPEAEQLIASRAAAVTSDGLESQGMRLQGMRLQGMRLQGMRLQGMRLQGMRLQGMRLQGATLAGEVLLSSGELQTVSGEELVGAILVGEDASGAEVEFEITAVEPDAEDASGEVRLYGLRYRDPGSGAWEEACEADAEGGTRAIPVAGVWDDSGARSDPAGYFTFGCTSGVIAKCVRWGYRPWEAIQGRSLRPYHQACTRMARADYCGNGRSHTREGTLIDVYDDLGVQTRVPGSGMLFEAAWVEDGAYCISKGRWSLLGALIILECPQKLRLPGLGDILHRDSCAVKLSGGNRSTVLTNNRSYLQLAL